MTKDSYEEVLSLVEKDIGDIIAVERMLFSFYEHAEQFDKLAPPVKRGFWTIKQTLVRTYALSIQKLLQGDGKATLKMLLKTAQAAFSDKKFESFDNNLEKLRASDTANRLKKIRDEVIAHSVLGSNEIRKGRVSLNDFSEFLWSSNNEEVGVIDFVVALDVFARDANRHAVWKRMHGTPFDLSQAAADETLEFIFPDTDINQEKIWAA